MLNLHANAKKIILEQNHLLIAHGEVNPNTYIILEGEALIIDTYGEVVQQVSKGHCINLISAATLKPSLFSCLIRSHTTVIPMSFDQFYLALFDINIGTNNFQKIHSVLTSVRSLYDNLSDFETILPTQVKRSLEKQLDYFFKKKRYLKDYWLFLYSHYKSKYGRYDRMKEWDSLLDEFLENSPNSNILDSDEYVEINYNMNDFLLFSGEVKRHAMIILSGAVASFFVNSEGDVCLVRLYKKGDLMNEQYYFNEEITNLSYIMLTDTVLAHIPQKYENMQLFFRDFGREKSIEIFRNFFVNIYNNITFHEMQKHATQIESLYLCLYLFIDEFFNYKLESKNRRRIQVPFFFFELVCGVTNENELERFVGKINYSGHVMIEDNTLEIKEPASFIKHAECLLGKLTKKIYY